MENIQRKEDLDRFVDEWADSEAGTKKAFTRLMEYLKNQKENAISFHPRPGVTYSLRAKHKNQRKREIYAMVDVIDDDPSNRWLSVCFYGEMISDPGERGDFVPGGLLGEDAVCFDIEHFDPDFLDYIEQRFYESHNNAANEKS